MSRQWLTLAVCSAALLGALASTGSAGIYIKTVRGILKVDGEDLGQNWHVSSPILRHPDGRLLAFDVVGILPGLHYSKNQGPHTTWTYVNLGVRKKDTPMPTYMDYLERTELFQLRASSGPYTGWSVARSNKQFYLTADAKKAATFEVSNRWEYKATAK